MLKGGKTLGKLNLVVADTDENYAKGVANYINTKNSKGFQVNCFTNQKPLKSFLQQNKNVDIILACPELYDEMVNCSKAKLIVILSQGVLSREYSGCEIINKYQTGEKLISSILFLYSKANPEEVHTTNREKDTRVVGVYSPAGGTGKTTIAVSLSIQCVERGMSAFYLNLEHIQSTGTYFDCRNGRNLSYVFYYLKEKNDNISFKLDGVKSTDPDTGVQYFNPPQNALEFDEIGERELEILVRELKGAGCYDFIFIDMPGSFDTKAIKLMELCDRVVITASEEPPVKYKLQILLDSLEKLNSARKWEPAEKFIYALNKYNAGTAEADSSPGDSVHFRCKLPQYTSYTIQQGGRLSISDNGFHRAIDELIDLISDI